jgi:restriction system protein
MTIPDFQTVMLPILQVAGDNQEHAIGDVIETLAGYFALSDEERKELLPSGRQFRFDNRIHWATTYLRKASLLQSTGRGRFSITERGLQVLNSNPPRIDKKFLEQFAEFGEFQLRSRQDNEIAPVEEVSNQSPEEILETSYQNLRNELAEELLVRIMDCSPRFFEKLVVDLLVAMGYGGSRKDAGQALLLGQPGDGGVDGIIKEDRLGLDVVYVQAKRWESVVGRPVVQAFAGSLEGFRARKGVLISTSQFSKDAKDYVERIEKKIVLIDGQQLAQYMIDYGIGVAEVATYVVKKADTDYFGDGQ